jgi:hypothetical protein
MLVTKREVAAACLGSAATLEALFQTMAEGAYEQHHRAETPRPNRRGPDYHECSAGRPIRARGALLQILARAGARLAREWFARPAVVGAGFSANGAFVIISIPSPVWAGAGVRGETVSVTDAIDPADCDCAKYLISGCSRLLFLKRTGDETLCSQALHPGSTLDSGLSPIQFLRRSGADQIRTMLEAAPPYARYRKIRSRFHFSGG